MSWGEIANWDAAPKGVLPPPVPTKRIAPTQVGPDDADCADPNCADPSCEPLKRRMEGQPRAEGSFARRSPPQLDSRATFLRGYLWSQIWSRQSSACRRPCSAVSTHRFPPQLHSRVFSERLLVISVAKDNKAAEIKAMCTEYGKATHAPSITNVLPGMCLRDCLWLFRCHRCVWQLDRSDGVAYRGDLERRGCGPGAAGRRRGNHTPQPPPQLDLQRCL